MSGKNILHAKQIISYAAVSFASVVVVVVCFVLCKITSAIGYICYLHTAICTLAHTFAYMSQ